MSILFRHYSKCIQAVLAIFMVTHIVAEPMPLANHKDIAIFREMKKQEIATKKAEFNTKLDVVGALGVLENDLAVHIIDPITFSRYALGMMIGNGYPDGVTTGLRANPNERAYIEHIIKMASAHSRALNFSPDQIWSANNDARSIPALREHIATLNNLSRIAPAEPSFEYAPQLGERYQDLDSMLREICASFAGTPAEALIRQAQIDFADVNTKPFLLTFISLSEFEQSEIVDVFNKYQTDDGIDLVTAYRIVAASCTNKDEAWRIIESHVLTPVQPLIAAIPAGPITMLDHTGSTLAQRDAIRAFLGALEDLGFSANKKEICLNALFRTLNLPAAAHAIAPPIQALIEAIPLMPKITDVLAATRFTLIHYLPIKNCYAAINLLEPIQRDIHYCALIEKIRRINFDKESVQINVLNRQKNVMIEGLIASRLKDFTPPKELISPVPAIAPVPPEVIDSVHALAPLIAGPNLHEHIAEYGEPPNAGFPASDDYRFIDTCLAFNNRLANFLARHCVVNYIPAASDAQRQQIIHTARQKLAQLDTHHLGTLIEKKCAKIALIEGVLHQLLSNQPALPPPQLLLHHQDTVANRNAIVQALVIDRLAEMGLDLGDDPDTEDQIRQAVEAEIPQVLPLPAVGHDYSNVQNVIALIDAIPPPETHVFTNMEKIKEIPSANWDDNLQNCVFGDHPALRRNAAESEQAYWARIGLYCIGVYNTKIKPHIFPDHLEATFNAVGGALPQLLPFTTPMFDAPNDASNVFSFHTPAGAPIFDQAGNLLTQQNIPAGMQDNVYAQQIYEFDLTRANLNAAIPQFRTNIARAYERVHAYAIKTLTELFDTGTALVDPQAGQNLVHNWVFPHGFTPERIELCKKTLFIFSYFDRPGGNYDEDYADMQMLIGRFAHCPDGKKTGIENIASRALTALTGQVLAEAEDFATFVNNIILRTFKSNTVDELAAHQHYENVSIETTIKHRNQAFWNIPTAIVPAYIEHYFDSDYAFASVMPPAGQRLSLAQKIANYQNMDLLLQYFYQHIYVGPHELVNQIYQYLHSANQVTREEFFDHVRAMLKTRRPFTDWKDEDSELDFIRELMQERYCSAVDPAMFTRRGIEIILFYAGYLAWNGPHHEHPLIADWQENLDWLRASDADAYSKIYTH